MLRLVCIGCVFLSCAPQGWVWQRFTSFSDFGSLSGVDGTGAPYANTLNGPLRFDEAAYAWRSVALPGAGGTLRIEDDGREFASTYGIYMRASASDAWQLIDGSRALSLEFIGQDAAKNLYAQTNFFSVPPGDVKRYAVRLAGTTVWSPINLDARVFTGLVFSPSGQVFAPSAGGDRLMAVSGTQLTMLPQPSALAFDRLGNRYSAQVPFHVQAVTASGELETWVKLFGKDTPQIKALVGFGKGDRFYAIAGSGAGIGQSVEYREGDLISIGRGESAWRLAASPLVDGAGNEAGPRLFDFYAPLVTRDGSILFAGCESGCTGSGNAFSYGVYRLTLGAQP